MADVSDPYTCALIDGRIYASRSDAVIDAVSAIASADDKRLRSLEIPITPDLHIVSSNSPRVAEIHESQKKALIHLEHDDLMRADRLMNIGFEYWLKQSQNGVDNDEDIDNIINCLMHLHMYGHRLDMSGSGPQSVAAPLCQLLKQDEHKKNYRLFMESSSPVDDALSFMRHGLDYCNDVMLKIARDERMIGRLGNGIDGQPWAVILLKSAAKSSLSSSDAVRMLRYLHDAGVDITERSRYGVSALDVAGEHDMPMLAGFLGDISLSSQADDLFDAFEDDAAADEYASLPTL